MWAADHHSPWTSEHWIEIRDSQWKAKDGQSRSFTFELHSVPSGKGGSKLGKQMFEVRLLTLLSLCEFALDVLLTVRVRARRSSRTAACRRRPSAACSARKLTE